VVADQASTPAEAVSLEATAYRFRMVNRSNARVHRPGVFDEATAQRVRNIRMLLDAGLSCDEIRQLGDFLGRDHGTSPRHSGSVPVEEFAGGAVVGQQRQPDGEQLASIYDGARLHAPIEKVADLVIEGLKMADRSLRISKAMAQTLVEARRVDDLGRVVDAMRAVVPAARRSR
jgi:hypothetical protein